MFWNEIIWWEISETASSQCLVQLSADPQCNTEFIRLFFFCSGARLPIGVPFSLACTLLSSRTHTQTFRSGTL